MPKLTVLFVILNEYFFCKVGRNFKDSFPCSYAFKGKLAKLISGNLLFV